MFLLQEQLKIIRLGVFSPLCNPHKSRASFEQAALSAGAVLVPRRAGELQPDLSHLSGSLISSACPTER